MNDAAAILATPPAAAMPLARFIGIPYAPRGRDFAGADCWGVCLLYARHALGLALPEYFYDDATLHDDAADLIDGERMSPRWVPAFAPWPAGVVHTFHVAGAETHCGIHVGGDLFLHSLKGRNACVESIRSMEWARRRIESRRYV